MKKETHDLLAMLGDNIKNNKFLFIGLVITIAGSVAAGILPPLVLEKMVNLLTQNRQFSLTIVLLYLVLLAAAGILETGKESLITVFGQRMTHAIRSSMCAKMEALPASYFTENEAGTITSRMTNDVDTIETLFNSGVISMVADGCKVISILVVIFMKSRGLGLLMLFVTPFLMLFTRSIQKKMLLAQMDNRVAIGRANQHIPESIQNIRMIHTTQSEGFMQKKYGAYIKEGYQAMEKSNFYDAIYSPVIITISALMISILMICSAMGGGMQVFFGMSAGTAVAVISYVSKVFDPLESIGMEIQNIQSAIAGIRRIQEFMTEPERRLVTKYTEPEKNVPAVSFNQVCFGYEEDQEVLHHLSFQVADKESMVLSGRTGIGKSTIFKLLLGMYQPQKGEICIFGIPVQQLSDKQRAQLIGYVEQTFHQIPGTLRDQITLKDDSITDQQVFQALTIVGLLDQVNELDKGLDTICSETVFSQGQFQLLSIARAVVQDPPILLLDEITANLDTLTEQRVLLALQEASANRTVVSISHRQKGSMCL